MANLPTRNNNPGDLKNPATGTFLAFNDPTSGFNALKQDLQGKVTGNTKTGLGPNSTLQQLAAVWAPASDGNDPVQYANTLAQKLKVAPTAPLASLNVDDLASAIAGAEGYQGSDSSSQAPSTSKMTSQQFAEKIKAKYPQYQSMDDNILAQKVLAKYPQYKTSLSDVPQSIEQQTDASSPSLSSELGKRVQQASGALGLAGQGANEFVSGQSLKGAEDVGSGLLQTAGAVAGGVGDIAQKGLELIPGIKSVEGAVGYVLGDLANTSLGKSVVSSVSGWAQAHPEAAANLGAVGNIASVIPMFKAASLAVSAGKDALGAAMKDSLTKAAGNEIEGVAMKTVGGQQLLSTAERRGMDPVGTILQTGALPTVETDAAGVPRYNTAQAFNTLSTEPEEAQLQQTLARVGSRADLDSSKQNAVSAVEDAFKNRTDYDAAVNQTKQIFDSYISRFGKTPTLQELNDIKRGVRDSVNFKSPKLDSDIHYIIGQSLMDDVEQGAKADGVEGVDQINKQMASKIQAKQLLKLMDGKAVKVTKWGKWARRAKMGLGAGGGELIGNALGIPGAGTVAGLLMEAGSAEPKTPLIRLSQGAGTLQKLKSLAKTAPLLSLRQSQSTPAR